MKINIEDYLHQIDAYFKGKEEKEVYMTFAMVVMMIFGFAYLLFWDSSLERYEKISADVATLSKKIENEEKLLKQNPESIITNLEKDIKAIKKRIIEYKDDNAYIKMKIFDISSLIYNERSWGEYIDSISRNAQKYRIKILQISNKYADTQSNSFGHILDIHIKTSGSYINTLKYINSLEQSDLVVDIHDFELSAEDKLISDLQISVWGIQ